MTFTFTDSVAPTSTAVDRAWYHEERRELAVDLHGVVYKYSGVSPTTWEKFINADSVGQFYRSNIKRNYSPAERLGSRNGIFFQREYKPVVSQGPGNVLTGQSMMPVSQNRSGARNRPPVDKWGYERPRGLEPRPVPMPNTFSRGGYVQPSTGQPVAGDPKPNTMSLRFDTDKTQPVVRKHAVTFEVNGQTRVHTLRAESVDEAVEVVEGFGSMLGLTFKVREVTVSFE